ncbi:hypothetical protein D3C72_2182960 [compost metagenome]
MDGSEPVSELADDLLILSDPLLPSIPFLKRCTRSKNKRLTQDQLRLGQHLGCLLKQMLVGPFKPVCNPTCFAADPSP